MIDHFGILAPFYDRLFQSHPTEKIIQHAELPVQGSLVDVGGGTGRISQVLGGLAKSVVVVDSSFGMLQQAVRKDNLPSVCSYSEHLPFENEHFDRVIMIDALHHVSSYKRTAEELWRILKPGGVIVIEEPNIYVPGVKLVAFFEKIMLMRSHFLTFQEMASLFPYSDSQSRVVEDGLRVYIIVKKSASRLSTNPGQ